MANFGYNFPLSLMAPRESGKGQNGLEIGLGFKTPSLIPLRPRLYPLKGERQLAHQLTHDLLGLLGSGDPVPQTLFL